MGTLELGYVSCTFLYVQEKGGGRVCWRQIEVGGNVETQARGVACLLSNTK